MEIKTTNRIFLYLLFLSINFSIHAQSSFDSESSILESRIDDKFDELTLSWINQSDYLKTYSGVNEYCRNPKFRMSVDSLLTAIHSQDSLIISKLSAPASYINWHTKKEEKTLEEVKMLEVSFGLDAFVNHMRKTCEFRNEIEANAERLKNGVGYESYDAKILLIETEMNRFLKKIDRLMIKVDNHLHQMPLE